MEFGRAKIFQIDWNVMQNFDDSELLFYQLTARQAATLLSQTNYIGWKTRWYNLPALYDLDAIRAELDFRLMLPVTALTEQEICDIVEACLPSYSLIQAMQTGIVNAQSTADNALTAASNALSVANNALSATVVNANAISVESGRIDDNVTAIQGNKDVALDHEDRISVLENAPNGSSELTVETKTIRTWQEVASDVWEVDVPSVTIDLSQIADDRVLVEATLYTTNPQSTLADLRANGNQVNANYQRRSFASGTTFPNPRILSLPPDSFDGVTKSVFRFEIDGLQTNEKHMLRVDSWSPAQPVSNEMIAGQSAWFFELDESLDNLTIDPTSGSIAAFGYYKIYALREEDVVSSVVLENVDPPDPVPVAWDATIRFWDLPSIPSFVTSNDFTRAGNGSYEANTVGSDFTGLFTIDAGSVGRFDTVSFQYFHLTTGVPDQSELWVGDFAQLLTFQLQDGTNTTPDFVFSEINSQTIEFTVNWYGLGASGQFQLGQIKLSGSGAIPSNLAAYGQEYF